MTVPKGAGHGVCQPSSRTSQLSPLALQRVAVRAIGDPGSLAATVSGRSRPVRYANGVASIDVTGLGAGSHPLVFTVSDYQEAKNMENVARILPNTRVLRTTIRVR